MPHACPARDAPDAMLHDLLREIRSVLEHQQALYGNQLWLQAANDPPRDLPGAAPADASSQHASPPLQETQSPESSMAHYDLFSGAPDAGSSEPLSPYERIEALIPDASPLKNMKTLAEVEAYLHETVLIPLDKTRINPVFGVGDPHADLMLIGEAPGADEDRTGEPFVGRAGMLLNKILEAVHFEREQVFISNILKSRPPNNRDPLPEEVEAHLPILYKQIALIQPKILLCLGKTAGNALLDRRSSLGALRGKFHDFYGLPVMVTYHPAALLRNPQWKRPTWEDVQLLRTQYDRITGA